MDELALLKALAKGHQGAFETLFNTYYTRLVVFASRLVTDHDMARELVQDVFVSFYEKREEIQIHTSLKAHLYQSVRNRCLNYIKREKLMKGHHQIILASQNDTAYFESAVEENELENRLFELVNELPEKCRQVFELSRVEGLKNDDIAQKLNISKRTVETQISKALKFLRENMGSQLKTLIVLCISLWYV